MVTHLHAGFKVEDYERWKEGYDASIGQRKASGEVSFQVFRNADDPNTVTVAFGTGERGEGAGIPGLA